MEQIKSFLFFVLANFAIILFFSTIYWCTRGETHFNGLKEDSSFLDSLYFSIVTLTTIGYGDISPKSSIMKIVVICQQLIVYVAFNTSIKSIITGFIKTM